MNKHIFKIITLTSASIVGALPLSLLSSQSVPLKIMFQGQKFANETALFDYLLNRNLVQINDYQVIGDVNKSYLDYSQGLLNKTQLPDYSTQAIETAWKKADGQLTKNYFEARNSYFNPALVVKRYSDGFGQWFEEHDEAIKSRNAKIKVNYQSYYDLATLEKSSTSPLLKIVSTKINPFNAHDIAYLKNNLSQNFSALLTQELLGQNKDPNGYSIALFAGDKMIAEQADISKKIYNSEQSKLQIINQKGESIKKGDVLYLQAAKISKELLQWKMGWRWIGEWQWNDHYYVDMTGKWVSESKKWKFVLTNDGGHSGYSERGGFYWPSEVRAITEETAWDKIQNILLNPENNEWLNFPGIYRENTASEINLTNLFDNTGTNSRQKLSYQPEYLTQIYDNLLNFQDTNPQLSLGNFIKQKVLEDKWQEIKKSVDINISNPEFNYAIDFRDIKVDAEFWGKGVIQNQMRINHFKGIEIRQVLKEAQLKINFNSKLLRQINYLKHNPNLKNVHLKIMYQNQPLLKVNQLSDSSFELNQLYNANFFDNFNQKFNNLDFMKNGNLSDLLTRYEINLESWYLLEDAIKYHLYQLKKIITDQKNINDANSIQAIFQNKKINFDNILIWGNHFKSNLKFGLHYLSNIDQFNPKINRQDSMIPTYQFAVNQTQKNSLKAPFISKIAKQYIVYNLNGEQISLAGQTQFDSFEIVRENILNQITPSRSDEKVFIKNSSEPVSNFKNYIVQLVIDNKQLYFATHKQAFQYALKHFMKQTIIHK